MKTHLKFIVATVLIWGTASASYSEEDAKPEPAAKAAKAEELASIDGVAITSADVERTLRVRYGPQIDAMPEEQRATAIKQAKKQKAREEDGQTLHSLLHSIKYLGVCKCVETGSAGPMIFF